MLQAGRAGRLRPSITPHPHGHPRPPSFPSPLHARCFPAAVSHPLFHLPPLGPRPPQARQTFSVSFYLVSIMYLLFDIEIVYLFPYAMTHASLPMYWTMNLFLAILVAGFAYEWGMGALEWRE